ncbi:MAG: hypothetical protein SPJ92_03335 [Bariatricus sp.]|nr:hypothetical protein [Bariatricus sp.]
MNTNDKKVLGTLGLENALTQNEGRLHYDEAGKNVLKRKEVLANILKYSIPEFSKYSCDEIITFIDTDSISDQVPIAPDTDTRIDGDDTSQSSTNEANLSFDILFKVIKPEEKNVHLHVDLELQGNYYPIYPIEKRGIYNLSRMISSQLDVVTKKTNYNILEKAYCIFICVGNVPQKAWNTVSYYGFANTLNIGNITVNPASYDLMGLILIRLGPKITEGVIDIIRFLHGLFYDMEELKNYIDFSQNEEFKRELMNMAITGDHLIELGREQGREQERARTEKAEAERDKAIKELDATAKELDTTTKERDSLNEQLQQALQKIKDLEDSLSDK